MTVYSAILFAAGLLFAVLAVRIRRGNTRLIQAHHQSKLRSEDRAAYGKAFASGLSVMAASLLLSGGLALFAGSEPFFALSLAVLFAGLSAGILLLVRAQNRYNKGVF